MRRTHILIVALAVLLIPAVGRAQNREHLQLTADLRMLQEQVSRLQLANNQLTEQLKAALKRVDDLSDAQVKGFADQKVLITQLGATLATVREKLDDNTVRVSQLTQEMTAVSGNMRLLATQINTLVGLLQPPVAQAAPTGEPAQGDAPGTAPVPTRGQTGATSPSPAGGVSIPASPKQIFDQSMGEYQLGHYDNAIDGFREFLSKFPEAVEAADAQLFVGDSFYLQKKCSQAIPEYQKVITNYKTSGRVAEAYYSQGVCYNDLNQRTRAQSMFEIVVKQFPNTTQAIMAQQKLQAKP